MSVAFHNPQEDKAHDYLMPRDPQSACAAIGAHGGPVILDFDETLYLRNSTEDFLDTARPGLAAKIILRVLDIIRPWRLTGGAPTRDNWRIAVIGLVFPWTWLLWSLRARRLARTWRNTCLIEALEGAERPLVVSIGFRPVITPLLAAMLPRATPPLIACRVLNPADRICGKRALVAAAYGEAFMRESLVVTDSADDSDLLAESAVACLTVWPEAQWREALSGVYMPFEYLSRVKRPRSRYVWTSIIQEDYAFWILASLGAGIALGAHIAGLALLLISFWAVYETGYVDNDRVGAAFEKSPKLSPEFARHNVATPSLAPWLWAGATGYLGVAMLAESWIAPLPALVAWAGVLIGVFLVFRVFNRVDKRSRVWLFGLLQTARISAFAAILPISIIGAAGLAAHFVALWVPYLVYRYMPGKDWPELPVFTLRLFCFSIFTVLVMLAQPVTNADRAVAAAFLAWNLFRARKELPAILRNAQRIDRPEGQA